MKLTFEQYLIEADFMARRKDQLDKEDATKEVSRLAQMNKDAMPSKEGVDIAVARIKEIKHTHHYAKLDGLDNLAFRSLLKGKEPTVLNVLDYVTRNYYDADDYKINDKTREAVKSFVVDNIDNLTEYFESVMSSLGEEKERVGDNYKDYNQKTRTKISNMIDNQISMIDTNFRIMMRIKRQ